MAVATPVTGADGIVEIVSGAVPLPSWPKLLSPQQRTVLSRKSAQLCSAPGARAAGVMSLTVTGTEELVVVPFPSWPSLFRPQQRTVPS